MFIAHYSNTMRNARPKMTPVIAAPKVQAKPVPTFVVKAKPVAKMLPSHVGNSDSTTRRRSARKLAAAAALVKRTHLSDYRSIVLAMGENPSVKAVIEAVCASHGVAVEDVLGDRRFRILSDARRNAIRMVSEVRPELPVSQLCRIFNRNHATILHSLGRVTRRAAK